MEEDELIKIPIYDEMNQKTADFYSVVSEDSRESAGGYAVSDEGTDL